MKSFVMYTLLGRRSSLFFLLYFSLLLSLSPGSLRAQEKSFTRAEEPPIIEVDLESIDFGEILCGEVVSKELKISNKGKGDLVLLKFDFTCGCTVPQVVLPSGETVVPDKKGEKQVGVLKQGETAHVEMEFSTLGAPRGKTIKSMIIYSNDPRNRELVLPMLEDTGLNSSRSHTWSRFIVEE